MFQHQGDTKPDVSVCLIFIAPYETRIHRHKETHTNSELSLITGGHFGTTPVDRSDTSCLWQADFDSVDFLTLKLKGNQVSAPPAASLLTICV